MLSRKTEWQQRTVSKLSVSVTETQIFHISAGFKLFSETKFCVTVIEVLWKHAVVVNFLVTNNLFYMFHASESLLIRLLCHINSAHQLSNSTPNFQQQLMFRNLSMGKTLKHLYKLDMKETKLLIPMLRNLHGIKFR